MTQLPDFLKGGEEARLIPVGASTQRESFACSVLLASLRVVQPFARSFFDHMNLKVGSWAQIDGYTEPVFRHQLDGLSRRPDGLLILDTGKKERRFIVETKIGAAKIDTLQLAEYSRLARANKIDAIITVSNELSVDPTHIPYGVPRETKNVPIFHFSWPYLVTLAELILQDEDDFDEEQVYILKEIIRYFDHESAGVICNTQMCAEWSNVIERIQTGLSLSASDVEVSNVVQCWHQRLASVCIGRTRQLKSPVTLHLSKSHWDQQIRLTDDVSEFLANHQLWASFEFPCSAAPIELVADAMRRNVTCRLLLDAPLNRQTYRARVRWLLKQLPPDIALPARLEVIWERNQRSSAPFASFHEDLDAAKIDSPSGPKGFEIVYVADLASKFAGPRTFIPALEEALVVFYEKIAQHIRPWQERAAVEDDTAVESLDELGESALIKETKPKVTRSGEVNGRAYSIFDDGSIEVDTGNGVQRFKSFAELSAAAARNGHTRPGV